MAQTVKGNTVSGHLHTIVSEKGHREDQNSPTVRNANKKAEKTMKKYYYEYFAVKIDLTGDDEERFNRIMEQQGIRHKGVLLRRLILQAVSLIEKDVYREEREEQEWRTSLYGTHLEWGSADEVIMKKTLQRREHIPIKDR